MCACLIVSTLWHLYCWLFFTIPNSAWCVSGVWKCSSQFHDGEVLRSAAVHYTGVTTHGDRDQTSSFQQIHRSVFLKRLDGYQMEILHNSLIHSENNGIIQVVCVYVGVFIYCVKQRQPVEPSSSSWRWIRVRRRVEAGCFWPPSTCWLHLDRWVMEGENVTCLNVLYLWIIIFLLSNMTFGLVNLLCGDSVIVCRI